MQNGITDHTTLLRPEGSSREDLLLLLLLLMLLLLPRMPLSLKERHRASSRAKESSASMGSRGQGLIGARQCSRGALGGRRATYKSGENCRENALRQGEYGPRQAPVV